MEADKQDYYSIDSMVEDFVAKRRGALVNST
jgi:hypothetical protein